MTDPVLLVIVVGTALAFDFTNGFHDTGNAMAASIATRALKPKQAVFLSASLNMVGAFLSLAVAATIAKGIVDSGVITLPVVLGGLVGGIVWNLLTWVLGIPSSSSHALVGGIVGSVLAAAGSSGVLWDGVIAKALIPALLGPVVAMFVSSVGTRLVMRTTKGVPQKESDRASAGAKSGRPRSYRSRTARTTRRSRWASSSWRSSPRTPCPQTSSVPLWVIISCALAMALGTYTGGWRVIRTLGKGLVELESRQGLAADASTATVILVSSHFGFPLSTTHVATGSVLGSGVGKKGASVRWHIAGRMFIAWLVTVPAAGLVGAGCYGLNQLTGPYVVFGLLVLVATVIYLVSRRKPVNHKNVNDAWKAGGGAESAIAESLIDHDPLLLKLPPKERKKQKKLAKKKKKAAEKKARRRARRRRRSARSRRPRSRWIMSTYVEWGALAQVLGVGLVIGAGLPTLFAVGVRALDGPGSRDEHGRRPILRVVAAVASFAVVVAAIVTAIYIIGRGGH